MAVNKVIVNDQTIIDLTSDTVTEEKLASGAIAHAASGAVITGTAAVTYDASTMTLEIPSFFGEVV